MKRLFLFVLTVSLVFARSDCRPLKRSSPTARGELGVMEELLMDMSRGTVTPLSKEDDGTARWSPDGKRLAFITGRTGVLDIYSKVMGSGPEEVLFASKESKNLSDWSPDGKYILFSSQSPATARDVWALPVDGSDRKPFPVAQTAAEEAGGRFSPDGKWVAYESDETGHTEFMFVRSRGPARRCASQPEAGSGRSGGAMARSCITSPMNS